MSITESEYSCFLGIIRRLEATNPAPGTREAERLEFYKLKVHWYQWERERHPAGSLPPDWDRYYNVLDRVLAPPVLAPPVLAPPGRPPTGATAPVPIARLDDGDSGTALA